MGRDISIRGTIDFGPKDALCHQPFVNHIFNIYYLKLQQINHKTTYIVPLLYLSQPMIPTGGKVIINPSLNLNAYQKKFRPIFNFYMTTWAKFSSTELGKTVVKVTKVIPSTSVAWDRCSNEAV